MTAKQLKAILKALKKEGDSALLNFIRTIFAELQQPFLTKKINFAKPEQKTLDIMARLFVGDEKCVALALSGHELLLASNKHKHIDEAITWQLGHKLLELGQYGQCRIGSILKLRYLRNGELIREKEKRGETLTFRYIPSTQTVRHVAGKSVITLSQAEHQIPFPKRPDTELKLHFDFNQAATEFSKGLFSLHDGEISYLPEMHVALDPLKQRAKILMKGLLMIAYIIEHAPHDIGRQRGIKSATDKNFYWKDFLMYSLSYEMAERDVYKQHINLYNLDHHGDPGTKALEQLYERLIANYQEFRKKEVLPQNRQTAKKWCQTHLPLLIVDRNAPQFIKANSGTFYERAAMYFMDLADIEDFIIKDCYKKGPFFRLLLKEQSLFSKSFTVKVIDGAPDIHAEMRLLEYHLRQGKSLGDYFGITLLCCTLCHFTLSRFNVAGFRGAHNILFPNWPLIEPIRENEDSLQQFLGNNLFRQYQQLQGKMYFPPSAQKPKKGMSRQRLAEIKQQAKPQQALALDIFSILGSINNKTYFEVLDIDQKYLLPDLRAARGQEYYPNEVCLVAKNIQARLKREYRLANLQRPNLEKGLRMAANNNRPNDIAYFIRLGADVNAQGPETGKTALHHAIKKGYTKCVKKLIWNGADTSIADNNDVYARDLAVNRQELLDLLP